MAPTTARDFLRAAAQRLDAAKVLYRASFNLDAQYIGGYAIECALKALILSCVSAPELQGILKRISSGAKWHRPEVLLGELRDRGITLPTELAKRMRRFTWTTDLRYETGRADTGETGAVLKTAEMIYHWVRKKFP